MQERSDERHNEYEAPNPWLQELLDTMVARFERLENKGFIAPYFLEKMKRDPGEVLKFLRQNRQVVSDQLERRLDDKQRPTKQQLINRGIVAPGYFVHGHQKAMARMNNRRSSVAQDLRGAIKIRPKPEELVKQGIISKSHLEKMYELAESEDEYDDEPRHAWDVSMLESLLFATIIEAIQNSNLETQKLEREKLKEMAKLNDEMKKMRHTLDVFLAQETNREVDLDDESRKEKFLQLQNTFHSLQSQIGDMKSATHKLTTKADALTDVEKKLIDLQNSYDQKYKQLRQREEEILQHLTQKRKHRDRALRVMNAEKSHQTWAMTKLQFTIEMARKQNELTKLRINNTNQNGNSNSNSNSNSGLSMSNELKSDIEFVSELETFLTSLKHISEHQNTIVAQNDEDIKELESRLTRIRVSMSKVKSNTFKEIHELHKDVIRADMITSSIQRKLSVATATDILTERRHNSTKIQRQLNTLLSQLNQFDVGKHYKNLNEILDIQIVMSDAKLKTFFSVFIQTFCQTLIDAELTHRQLNSDEPPDPASNVILSSLYGMSNIVSKIASSDDGKTLTLDKKIHKIVTFIKMCKKAMYLEKEKEDKSGKSGNGNDNETEDEKMNQVFNSIVNDNLNGEWGKDANGEKKKDGSKKKRIKTYQLSDIVVYVARKLCTDDNTQDEIERTHSEHVGKLAAIRSYDIFEAIVNSHKFFEKQPQSRAQAASIILRSVFGINTQQPKNY